MKIKNYIIQGLFPLFAAGMFIVPVLSSCEEDDAPANTAPTLTVQEVTNALRTSATLTGSISGETSLLKEYGFDYSTSQDFPSDRTTRVSRTNSGDLSFLSVQVKDLTPNERYYYRLYASTGVSTGACTVYSDTQDFRTANMSAPQISDLTVDSIGEQYARLIFQVEDYGNEVLIECGVSYKKSDSKTFIPVASEEITTDDRYVIEITDLEADTQYDFRPYAKNAQDKDATTGSIEGYGNILTQKTGALLSASVETGTIDEGDISITSVKVAGTILSAVGSNGAIDECGFVYSQTNPLPTYNSDSRLVHQAENINVSGSRYTYTEEITDLLQKTLYYVRAYAKNTVDGEERISYGTTREITTNQLNTPILEFVRKGDGGFDFTSTATSLTVKATITNYDANALIEKGVIWSRSNGALSLEEAKAAGTYQAVTTGENAIVATISGLEMASGYYVRAYAVYKSGDLTETGYSDYTHISTEGFNLPSLELEINNEKVTYNSVELTGKIPYPGNANITERGFVLSHNLSEVTLENCDKSVKADKNFIATITGLTYQKNYYVRAYVKCELGGRAETVYSGWNNFQTRDIDRPTFDAFESSATLSSLNLTVTIEPGKQGTIVKRGFCAVLNENNAPEPTINDALKTEEAVTAASDKTYKAELKGLLFGTGYRVRAYAVVRLEDGEQLVCYSGTLWTSTEGLSINMQFTSTDTQCTVQATIESDVDLSNAEYGFAWTEEDIWDMEKVTNRLKCTNMDAKKTFSGVIGNLTGGKRYYLWVYTTINGRTIFNNGRWEFTTKRAPGQDDNVSPDQKQ